MRVQQTLNGYVLVRPLLTTKKIAGIDMPDSVDTERPTMGEVLIDVSFPIDKDATFNLPAGSTVAFSSLAARKIMHGEEPCLLVPHDDIQALLTE